MFVYDSPDSVDFVTGRGHWQAGGQYAVQVYPISSEIKDANSFWAETKKFSSLYMTRDRAAKGFNFEFLQGKQFEQNGRPVYQAIAEEKGKAGFVATFVLHPRRITVASLVYPLANSGSAEDQVPWKCYSEFVSSIIEVP
jgi:hypothetical protein